jgi:hypothetical protein
MAAIAEYNGVQATAYPTTMCCHCGAPSFKERLAAAEVGAQAAQHAAAVAAATAELKERSLQQWKELEGERKAALCERERQLEELSAVGDGWCSY